MSTIPFLGTKQHTKIVNHTLIKSGPVFGEHTTLEQERDSFLSELQAVEQAIERGDNPPLELIELRSKLTYLIGTLEHTAKAFTEKAEQENNAVNDEMITVTEAGKILGVRKGMVWFPDG